MDRRRAAAALLALAACFACSAAAPTSSDHTALDLYEGTKATEGCYYNFQHYGEGDRIMTNEPCLNCTCHNRMLMCYLRVCPFTKAIGQDCTVEKRADQCCPIVTCPDVPVDLLTSTSTTSPAEYGGTAVGKVDNYGCSINGKYFPEGAKVPPTPNKPCEHCYCIRNMTTCVMQECTLHVDGCTPIYHKDVCCPVRYFCDHPEDEMPLLDDMTTTVRPTPGFLLTTTTTEEAVTQTQKRECIENDQLYPDGALIKTEKPCVHCYCMKGDIVCVVQECGTPMENEGKNCTSLPPREGQCCPDTYICEGDDLTTEVATDMPYEALTTLKPPRRSGVEGSGYRNEPDEITDTEIPPFVSEIEGSGEEPGTTRPTYSTELLTPDKETTQSPIDDRLASTVIEDQFSPDVTSTPILEDAVKATTEPDKGLNTIEEDVSEPSILEKTSPTEGLKVTEPITTMDQDMVTSGIAVEESSKPSLLEETSIDELKTTSIPLVSEPTIREGTTEKVVTESTEPSTISEFETEPSDIADGESSETSILKLTTLSDEIQVTKQTITEQNTVSDETEHVSSEPSVIDTTTQKYEIITDSKQEIPPSRTDSYGFETTKTPPKEEEDATVPTVASVEQTPFSQVSQKESVQQETPTTSGETITSTESIVNEENTIPSKLLETESPESSLSDKTTPKYDITPTDINEHTTAPGEIVDEESTKPSLLEITSTQDETKATESTISGEKQPTITKDDETITTEPTYRKEDKEKEPTDLTAETGTEKLTTALPALTKETAVTSEYAEGSSLDTVAPSIDYGHKLTTTQTPDTQAVEETTKESTTELSDVTKPIEESATSPTISSIASEVVFTSPADEKQELPLSTTINPEDNEIGEDLSPTIPPGRIPGEGDCLLNGITYRNDSSIPSSNKCHSSCKCVSSIVKCDPIICSPQPEYMDNCQPIYDTPDSCCPTYICDHSKETIPPQPHSQMSGTESPQPSPTIECNGDQCEVTQEQQPPSIPSELCTSGDCKYDIEKPIPTYPSIDQPQVCIDDKCTPTKDATQVIPAEHVGEPEACDNLENCKETHKQETAKPSCEGESCINVKDKDCNINNDCDKVTNEKPCEDENCEIKPESTPDKGIPQICEDEYNCKKETKIPETAVSSCEGESCKGITSEPCDKESGCEEPVSMPCVGQNCATQPEITYKDTPQICENQEDCKETKIPEDISKPSQPSHDEICTEESGCKKPDDQILQECVDEICRRKQTSGIEHKLPSECKDPECLQKPIYPSQETTINVQLGTESPITSQPISASMETTLAQWDLETEQTEPPVTKGQEKYTEISFATSPTEYMTDKPYTFSELPESTFTEKEEVITRKPEDITTKSSKTSTQESGTITELPEIHITETQSVEDNAVTSEITEKEEQVTELPAISVTDLSLDEVMTSKPAVEPETSTLPDGDKFTEQQEVYTTKSEDTVTEHIDTTATVSPPLKKQDELLPPHVTESEKITHAPEVSEVEQPEKATATPEILVTESERDTIAPEHSTSQISEIITKSPVTDIDQEVSTEVQKLGTELPEFSVVTPEIEPTISSVTETHETGSDRPRITDVPDDSATKTQEITTESEIEHELSTKVPLSSDTASYEQYTELPQATDFVKEIQTELPVSRFTGPQESLTNVGPEDADTQKPMEVPESLMPSTISTDDESKTKAPELFETGEKGVSTEEGNLPQTHTTQSQDVGSTITEKTTQQKDTYTKLPIPTESVEYGTKTPEITIKDEDVQTDSPISLITELEQTDVTPTIAPISEHETELPTKESEPSISEVETKTEIPDSHKTEPEKMITETPDQYITSQEDESKISDKPEKEKLPIYTEKPHSLVTGQEIGVGILLPEQQAPDESPATEKEDKGTEKPTTSVTEVERVTEQSPSVSKVDQFYENEIKGTDRTVTLETESPYVPTHEEASSEIPVSLFSEKESTVKVTEAGESSVTQSTQTPETLGEQEIHTISPLLVSTEQYGSETTDLDKITKLPESETEIPVIISTESQKGTEIPSEISTKHPDSSLTEESTASPEMKPYTLTTQEPSDLDHEKGTTESLETIKPDQAYSTEAPAVFTSHEESVTDSEIQEIPDKKPVHDIFTKSPEQEERPTTKSYIPNITEFEEITTKVPFLPESHTSETESSVSTIGEQEIGTQAPEIESTEPQEFEIKTEEPSVFVTQKSDAQPETGEMQTESPAVQDTDTVPPKSDTEYHEPALTEESVTATLPSKIHDVEQEGQTELPVSSVTQSEEMETKQPATIEEEDLDKKEPKPSIIVPTESAESTESYLEISTKSPISEVTKLSVEPEQTTKFSHEYSETTPYLVELEEHPHKVDEDMSTAPPSEEPISVSSEVNETDQQQLVTEASTDKLVSEEALTELPLKDTQKPYDEEEGISLPVHETTRPDLYSPTSEETPEVSSEPSIVEDTSKPEIPLPTVAYEETPDQYSESTPVKEARPDLHLTTLALEETPSEPTLIEESSRPDIYHTTSVLEETTEKSSKPTTAEEPSRSEVEQTSLAPEEIPEKSSESSVTAKETTYTPAPSYSDEPDSRFSTEAQTDRDKETATTEQSAIEAISPETEKPFVPSEDYGAQPEKDVSTTLKPQGIYETTAPEEEFIPAITTTAKVDEKDSTQSPEILDKFGKPEEKPGDVLSSTLMPETAKPGFNELQPTDEVPSPEDEGHFPPSGGYGQEPDYVEEDQAFGPGTCRYGGKVYVSAQQIPRDDPCDFCFCFRSDIICLQQSCPPPIHGCHEEPIQGFCCPRYECPVSMATTLNVTTTTTTTTTTLPPHFLPHAYKGAAQRRGCQIKGHTYKVGEVVRASSGPCLHCTCGGDGQMKCDPKVCTPEPMLRQMIAAAVSSKRRR